MKETTHILENASSFIDLFFTSQPSLIVDSGTHPSLHRNIPPIITLYFMKMNSSLILKRKLNCLIHFLLNNVP